MGMENMRKSLLFDAFGTSSSNVMHQNDVIKTEETLSSSQSQMDSLSQDTNPLNDDEVVKEEKVLLPSIKSSIDKFGGNADLVQMLDANEENKEDERKKKMKSSKRMKKVSS